MGEMARFLSTLAVVHVSLVSGARIGLMSSLPQCPPKNFSTVANFDLESFVQKRWYIQQQMAVNYLPVSKNRCVWAEYKLKEKKTFLGYDVDVHNHAEEVAPPHKEYDSGSFLNAKIVD